MKKIYSLLFLALGLAGFTACSDDTDNPYAHESSVSIVSSKTAFTAVGGSGSIHYTAAGNVSVSSSQAWCTAQLSGDSIILAVAQNENISGRAANVTLRCGSDSVKVAVVQNGVVTEVEKSTIGFADDNARTERYGLKCDLPLTLVSVPEWLTASLANDSLYLNVTENTTGHLRSGYVVYQSGNFKDSLRVCQADFDKDIAGKYNICYYRDAEKTKSDKLSKRDLTATGLTVNPNLTLPVSYDPSTCSLTVSTGSYLGTYKSNEVYLAFGLPNDYWTGYNTGIDLTCAFEYNDVDGTFLKFSGTVEGMDVISFMLRNFKAKNFTQDNDNSTNSYVWYAPELRRVASAN